MKKLNCWEFKKCGRQPGGEHVNDMGLCPATIEEKLDGIHDGSNGGRACWVIAGTLCKGEKQGSFAQKLTNCVTCVQDKSAERVYAESVDLQAVKHIF